MTRRTSRKRLRHRKNTLTVVAMICVTALLLGGAMAWTDFTQSRVNKFRGTTDADVTLHDEFDGVEKNVFVENSGTSTIYVRVRLDEYMKVGESLVFGDGADVKDKNTWDVHTYGGLDFPDCGHAELGLFHDWYEWFMTGAARPYKRGTPGMVYHTLGAGGEVDKTGPVTTEAARAPLLLSEYLRLKNAVNNGTLAAGADTDRWNGVLAGCWILDDTPTAAARTPGQDGEGWAYWSQPLEPDHATNLLLERVEKRADDPPDDWIYRIDVKLQAVTANDFAKWGGEAAFGYKLTAGARILVDMWNKLNTPIPPALLTLFDLPVAAPVRPAGFTFTVDTSLPVSDAVFGTSDLNILLPIGADAGNDYTVYWDDDDFTGEANANSHTYTTAGLHTVTVAGDLPGGLHFYNGTAGKGEERLVSIDTALPLQTGTGLTDIFRGCVNLAAVSGDVFAGNPQVADFGAAFRDCAALTEIPDNLFDAQAAVDNLDEAFMNCAGLTAPLPEFWNDPPYTRLAAASTVSTFTGCDPAPNFGDVPLGWK